MSSGWLSSPPSAQEGKAPQQGSPPAVWTQEHCPITRYCKLPLLHKTIYGPFPLLGNVKITARLGCTHRSCQTCPLRSLGAHHNHEPNVWLVVAVRFCTLKPPLGLEKKPQMFKRGRDHLLTEPLPTATISPCEKGSKHCCQCERSQREGFFSDILLELSPSIWYSKQSSTGVHGNFPDSIITQNHKMA